MSPAPRRPSPVALAVAGLLLPAAGLLAPLAGLVVPVAAAAQSPVIAPTEVPAAGRHAALVTTATYGRYSVQARSAQGVSLQLVSRMAGPGPAHGTTGEQDGRIDAFLDRGEYQVVAVGHAAAEGTAKLSVHPFVEQNGERAPRLVELKPVETELRDLEQRSWWIEIPKRRHVALEAAGRSLGDLRLWKDGAWLVDATPETLEVTPREGKPLTVRRITTALEPGLYRLVAYGGPPSRWAEEDGTSPLHLRYGIPPRPSAARSRHEVSPFGVDRFLVSRRADYFRLELPEARDALLGVRDLSEGSPFSGSDAVGTVTKKSTPPVTEVRAHRRDDGLRVVTVQGEAGQPYVLQHFDAGHRYVLGDRGRYWVSSIHSGHPADSVDATGLLVPLPKRDEHVAPAGADVIELGEAGWAGRGNLLGDLTLFLYVGEAGRFAVRLSGTDARCRIEPFMLSPPRRYEAPSLRGSGSEWDLEAGYHVLTVVPEKKGIVEIALHPAKKQGMLGRLFGSTPEAPEAHLGRTRAQVRFGLVEVGRDRDYVVMLNERPGVESGIVVRSLPLDLTDALYLALRPGEEVEVPFTAPEDARLKAVAEDGTLLPVALGGGAFGRTADVSRGAHSARVRNDASATVTLSLTLERRSRAPDTPTPRITDRDLAALPDFPVLTAGRPRHLDLGRTETATFVVRAASPGLYRLETTGLLETEATVRTRIEPDLATRKANGVGRNALVQQYLREGDYQLTVRTRGRSKGHLGVQLEQTRLVDGGELASGTPARIALPAGDAVLYTFRIPEGGRYRIRSVGVDRTFRCRLEDADGWPLVKPGGSADLTRSFEAGTYRFIVLPEAVASRRVTLLEEVAEAPTFEGHGPHRLPLTERVSHIWRESEARTPDVWVFEAPAPMETRIVLTGEMQADLVRVGQAGTEKVAYVAPLRGWEGTLEPGTYHLHATCFRKNDRQRYELAVHPEPLVDGLARKISAPAEVPVSIGRHGLVEIGSFGSADVRAELHDAEGRVVARSDDRSGDWNFQLTPSLSPGRFTLKVLPVGRSSAQVEVQLRRPAERLEDTLEVPAVVGLRPGPDVLVHPLELPARADLLVVTARSGESVGIALEVQENGAWRPLGGAVDPAAHLVVPLAKNRGAYRLRVWSADGRGSPVKLAVTAVRAPRVSERGLAQGLDAQAVADTDPPVAVAAADLSGPGMFRITRGPDGMAWSATPQTPARAGRDELLSVGGRTLWLAARLPDGSREGRISAERVALAPGRVLTVSVDPAAAGSVDLEARGLVLVTAESVSGQPGLRLGDDPADRMGVAPGFAATAALAARDPRVQVRIADGGHGARDVRLRLWRFDRPQPADAGGRLEGRVAAGAAGAWSLGKGVKTVRLSLAPRGVALFTRGDTVEAVHMATDEARHFVLHTEATALVLLNTGEGELPFAADVTSGTGPLVVRDGGAYERREPTAGVLRLPVRGVPGEGRTVRVRGAEEATFVGKAGRILRGRDLAVRGDGDLLVPHGPGHLLVWLDPPGAEGAGLLRADEGRPSSVSPPTQLRLSGDTAALRLQTDAPRILRLHADLPLVTAVSHDGGPPRVELHPTGPVSIWQPAGETVIRLRALGGGPLHGVLEILATQVDAIGEGLGPEILLGPGEGRVLSFEVKRPGKVGVGVRAVPDVVDCALVAPSGRVLGTGVVQLHELTPGTWLLALRAPAGSGPVRVRPAVVGLEPPDTGPPEEVVRRYLQMAAADSAGDDR